MRISHRVRLATVSAASSGLVLALLFASVVSAARAYAFVERRQELTTALSAFTLDPNEAFDLREFREANPALSAGIFGGETVRDGPVALRPVVGFVAEHDRLLLGKRFRGQTVVVGADWRETHRGLRLLALVLAGLWAPLTLLIGVATYLAARAVFRPLERLSAQAANAAGSNLGERLHTDDHAEFGEFAARLNEMLDRIEASVQRGERFSADAAHELRTPLAILRMRLETSLLQPRAPEEYAATLRRGVEEIDRLTHLAEALLRTARGELAAADMLDLEPCVLEAVVRWRELFEAGGVVVRADLRPAQARIVDEELRIVLDNLLDNALRFAPPGSEVSIVLDENASLKVSDHGPGVPQGLGERVFERFVRADEGRNRSSGGAGIGLSVVRRIVEARGGTVALSETPGGGATLTVRLPVVERIFSPAPPR